MGRRARTGPRTVPQRRRRGRTCLGHSLRSRAGGSARPDRTRIGDAHRAQTRDREADRRSRAGACARQAFCSCGACIAFIIGSPPPGPRLAGVRRPSALLGARGLGPAAAVQARRPDPDRLGQRARARPLPARVQPPRPLRPRGSRPALPPRSAASVRVLGPRGVAAAGRTPAAASLAHGPRRATRRGAECDASSASGRSWSPTSSHRYASVGRSPPPSSTTIGRDASRAVVGLVGRQAGDRVAVLVRPGELGAPAALRAALRPPRAGAAARGSRRPDARGRGGPARAGANRRPLARGGGRARPARLLPPAGRGDEAPDRRAGGGWRAARGRGRGLGPNARIPRRRCADTSRGSRPRR